jgi:O-methyltransferase
VNTEMPEIFKTYTRYDQLGLSGDLPNAINAAFSMSGDLTGDYYEFGLYAGTTFYHAQQEAKRLGLNDIHFWGFDSFRGLPSLDEVESKSFIAGSYACSREVVERLHNQFGVDWSHVHLIEGWYEDVLTKELAALMKMGPAKIVLVDCDVYRSTVPVLEFISPLLQKGTIILFDDWNCFGDRDLGERRAFREFLLVHQEWTAEEVGKIGTMGVMFIMRENS